VRWSAQPEPREPTDLPRPDAAPPALPERRPEPGPQEPGPPERPEQVLREPTVPARREPAPRGPARPSGPGPERVQLPREQRAPQRPEREPTG